MTKTKISIIIGAVLAIFVALIATLSLYQVQALKTTINNMSSAYDDRFESINKTLERLQEDFTLIEENPSISNESHNTTGGKVLSGRIVVGVDLDIGRYDIQGVDDNTPALEVYENQEDFEDNDMMDFIWLTASTDKMIGYSLREGYILITRDNIMFLKNNE